jgi:2-phosphoglycerate kinase
MIGGVSGCGKSTVAEALMKKYKYNWVLVDDIRNAMSVAAPKENPIHAFAGYTIYDKGYSSEKLADFHRKVHEEVCKGVEVIIEDHLHRKIPMIIEGDDLTPEFVKKITHDHPNTLGFLITISSEKLLDNILRRAEKNGEKVEGSYWDYINMIKFENGQLKEEIKKNDLKSFELSQNMEQQIVDFIEKDL